MEFHHGRNNLQDSRGIPLEASCHSPFADQTYQVGYMGPDFRRNQHEVFFDHHQDPPVHPHPHPHPHPHHMHGGILREIEKEIITEEIIIADIARKRALEAEVRMIERKLTLLRRDRVLYFQPSPQMNHDLPTRLPLSVAEADWSSLEERLTALLEETKRMNGRHEILLPLQGEMKGLGNQETGCFYEVPKDDKKIIFLGKKSANISGSDKEKKKKNRDEWSCALCKFSATSEETLNEHLNEKKHKLNIEALRPENDRKNYNIGLLPKTAIKSSTIIKTLDPPAEQEAKITTEKRDLPLQAGYLTQQPEAKNNKNISVSMKKDLAAFEVSSNELPRTDTKKNNVDQWSCGLCGICTTSEQGLNAHKHGKKHQLKLDDLRWVNILPTKATETLRIIKNIDQPAEQEVKLTPEYLLSKETKKAELSKTYSLLQSGNDTLQPEAKRDETMYASRETSLAPSQVGFNELPKTDTANSYRGQWTCVLCEITATREQDLKDHLHGKKHKLVLDALESKNARKICSLPKKPTKPNIIVKAVDPPADQTKKQYPSGKSRVALSCALCKVRATSEQALNEHLQGKKHKLKLDDLRSECVQKSCCDGILPKKSTKSDMMTGTVDSPGEPKSKLATGCFMVTGIKKADTRKQYLPLQPGDRTQQPEIGITLVKKGNACGIDGMALEAKEVASNELPKTDIATKNDVNTWNCSLCEVSTTSEQGLNEHLHGKKHKLKLDHLKSESSQKQIGVELLPMKVIKSTNMAETVDPPADQESKFETEYFLSKVTKKTDLSKQDSPPKDGDQTRQPEVNKGYAYGMDGMALGAKEVAPNELPKTDIAKKNEVKKWNCSLCEVSTTSEQGLNEHLHGKKHKLKLDDLKSESAQRQIGVEFLLMKVVKSDMMAETVDPPADQESKLGSEYFLSKETKNTDLSKQDSPDGDQTLQPEVKKGHASGVDGMALAAKEVASNKLPETDIAKKNDDGNKWNWSFCEGSTTCEQGLNEVLRWKKHMLKLDDLRSESAQKQIGGELLPKKTTESAIMMETVNPPEDEESKHGTEYLLPNETIKTDLRKQDSPPKAGVQTLQPEDKKDVSPDQGGWFWRSLTNFQSRIMQKRVSERNGAVPCEVVSNTGEQSLTEQLLGKHNPMLDVLRSESGQDNCSLLPPPEREPNLATEYFLPKKTEEATLREQDSLPSQNPQVVKLKNETESALMAKKGDDGSEKYNFWCDLCRIGTLSQKNMLDHEKGKKHVNLLKKKYQHCGDGPADIQKIHDFVDYDLWVSPGNKITPDSIDET